MCTTYTMQKKPCQKNKKCVLNVTLRSISHTIYRVICRYLFLNNERCIESRLEVAHGISSFAPRGRRSEHLPDLKNTIRLINASLLKSSSSSHMLASLCHHYGYWHNRCLEIRIIIYISKERSYIFNTQCSWVPRHDVLHWEYN